MLFRSGSALVAGTTRYLIVPFSSTLSAWNIVADQGTATVQIWKVPTGTAIPNASNNISGNGLTIGSGTAVHSSNMTGFTNAAVGADDIFGFHLSAVASATFLNTTLECVQ